MTPEACREAEPAALQRSRGLSCVLWSSEQRFADARSGERLSVSNSSWFPWTKLPRTLLTRCQTTALPLMRPRWCS